jgi:serine/threonine protein kinase
MPRVDSLHAGVDGSSGLGQAGTGNIGTYLYLSLEAMSHGEFSPKSDVYACGLILFELWRHFETEMERALMMEKLRSYPPGLLDPAFAELHPIATNIVRLCTASDVDGRPSAVDLLHLLPLHETELPEGASEELQINSWTQFKAQRRQVLRLEGQVTGLEGQVTGLEGQVTGLETEVQRLREENRALRGEAQGGGSGGV